MFGHPLVLGGLPVIVREDRSGPPRVSTVSVGGICLGAILQDGTFLGSLAAPFPGAAHPLLVRAPRDHSLNLELYHETSEEAAERILSSQRMLRGQGGLAGGGIYFAESPAEARRKANQRGAMLKATVRVGRMKVVQRQGSTTFTQLVSEGYDSVKILGRDSGTEYVVYNCAQVTNIRRV
ncbi:unnamed protein product [Effrenium voratum]|uniref:Uncharacterized protein n=2 Tax=Effrenium voratum TaxID=2562239 RepID=A0AA36MTE1_9DINO|nr:unnamed protein product [Effrenium voratum]